MIPWIVAGIVLTAVALLAAVIMAKRKKRAAGADTYRKLMGGNASPATQDTPEEAQLRQNLRVKLLHQEDKIDAAIAFERERNLGASQAELMRSAIARWERDNQ